MRCPGRTGPYRGRARMGSPDQAGKTEQTPLTLALLIAYLGGSGTIRGGPTSPLALRIPNRTPSNGVSLVCTRSRSAYRLARAGRAQRPNHPRWRGKALRKAGRLLRQDHGQSCSSHSKTFKHTGVAAGRTTSRGQMSWLIEYCH